MKMSRKLWPQLLLASALLALGCNPDSGGPQSDSHTNWLKTCSTDSECGKLSCVCGLCTSACDSDDACSDAVGAACVAATDPGAIAACAGAAPPVTGMCLPRCGETTCGAFEQCLAGSCQPQLEPSAEVIIDSGVRFQTLTGFGATIGYAEHELATLADRAALDAAMFSELGLDVLRLRNRYGEVDDSLLGQATTLVSAARDQLGRAPLVVLTSWSPPAALKQNGATFCLGGSSNCTLSKLASGEFDYASFGAHWRASLDAYALAGLVPDYIGIQNNPDWVPPPGIAAEACKFLPKEGVEGVVSYPGFAEALDAVAAATADLANPPRVLAPELSGIRGAGRYLMELDAAQIHAIAHHMYGEDPADISSPTNLIDLQAQMALPLFQTEMQAGGFDTALLMHRALASEGAAMYLQTALVGPRSGPATNPTALIGLENGDFVLQDPYYAMQHYARFTDPGWERVESSADQPDILASAYVSPESGSLSVVVINAGAREQTVALSGQSSLGPFSVARTVFDGSERMAELGTLPEGSAIRLPPRSMATARFEGAFE